MSKKSDVLFIIGTVALSVFLIVFYLYKFSLSFRFSVTAVVLMILFMLGCGSFVFAIKLRLTEYALQGGRELLAVKKYKKLSAVCAAVGAAMLILDHVVYWSIIVNRVYVAVFANVLHMVWFLACSAMFIIAIALISTAKIMERKKQADL